MVLVVGLVATMWLSTLPKYGPPSYCFLEELTRTGLEELLLGSVPAGCESLQPQLPEVQGQDTFGLASNFESLQKPFQPL